MSRSSPLQRNEPGELPVEASQEVALRYTMALPPGQSKACHGTFTALAQKFEFHQSHLGKV